MQCYTELMPPTGVTHALAVPFISATANNLVVVKTSQLQIFSLITIPRQEGSGLPENGMASPDRSETTKLILEREYPLPGIVSDLSRVKILNSKNGGEAVLLAFRNAKLSLIEWDPVRYGISTISIHYYERDDLTRSPWVPDLSSCGNLLSVEPSSRCAVFNFGIRNLAIIPFHQPGDDLAMDEYGSDHDEGHMDHEMVNGADAEEKSKSDVAHQTPYGSSFVLPLAALDPSLLHPISLAFLYEYREPTFGILYSQIATSNALLHERKDAVFYAVFTLDLEQRASTTLLSVSKLPSDLSKVVALPPPVGGALLIGSNELVHVDQGGKTNAVGVNEFSRQVSAFSMTDQSDLAFRLEGCTVERLGANNGDLLLVLSSGEMALVTFKLDGRSVSGISVHRLPPNVGGGIMNSAASCSACLGDGNLFFGSEDADSILLGWSPSSSHMKKHRPQPRHVADGLVDVSDEEGSDDDVYEDDLYSTAPDMPANGRRGSAEDPGSGLYNFRINDKLPNIGPLRDFTLGQSSADIEGKGNDAKGLSSELEMVASKGSGSGGGIVIIKREIDPHTVSSMEIESGDSVWTVSATQGNALSSNTAEPAEKEESRHYVIISKLIDGDKEESVVLHANGQELEPFKSPDVNPNEDLTVDIGTLAGRTRVVQVLKSEVRSYDSNLGLAQIYPVWDEDTSEERMAVSASFADPYLAIIRDDSSLLLLQVDGSGDIDEVEISEDTASRKWLSCCLYRDKAKAFSRSGASESDVCLFLLSSDYKLSVLRLPDQKVLSIIEGVDCTQSILSSEPPRRSTAREPLIEAVVADLGDSQSSYPYLILRTENDDIMIYTPFASSNPGEKPSLCFFRETNHGIPPNDDTQQLDLRNQRRRPLRILPDVSGYSTVFLPGNSASFVFRTSTSSPHIIRLREDYVRGLSSFDSSAAGCDKGFIYLDSMDTIRICKLPHETQFDYSWPLRVVHVGEQVDHLAYSSSSRTYVLGTSRLADFKLPDDDELHPEWRNEEISLFPKVEQSSVKVISPVTWSVIDSYELGTSEFITAVKSMDLEVSENTHERREMIVVGTAVARGEDIPARGGIYVFEVIKVVPNPEKPGTDRRLKLIGKESVKGAVTGLSGIGGQGFLIVAQGQKCMVRGLKEDGSLLPVAFLDMQCYVNVVKELKGTGMCILGDAVKGIWFAGYSEEPYKMSLFSKDTDYIEVVAADFLPEGSKLYMLVADSDCNLHVLQYDPEDPKSSNGDRLLARSKFHTGNFASTMTLLPRTAVSSENMIFSPDDMDVDLDIPLHQILIASQNGSLGLVTSVSEESYRRLSALQSQLTNTLEHPCGLNPRAFRAVESDGTVGRGMIDGTLLRQWLDLGKQRQTEIATRVGASEWEIKADLEAVGGGGLGYL